MSEEMIIRHCSPTLAGLKTGNLFSCSYKTLEELRDNIRLLNRKLTQKGLRVVPLKFSQNKVLIYVFRPTRLKNDLFCEEAAAILKKHGYSCDTTDKCLVKLINRLRDSNEFPHEIGLFLGYPPEDVEGFIQNSAGNSKCVGSWKVYGDEEKAKKLFRKYKKCTDIYIKKLKTGHTIERLTVTV